MSDGILSVHENLEYFIRNKDYERPCVLDNIPTMFYVYKYLMEKKEYENNKLNLL